MGRAILLFVLLSLSTVVLLVSGAYVLAGFGWALIVAGLLVGGAAAVVRRGIADA